MKKIYSAIVLFALCAAGLFAVNENVAVWEQIYRKADNYDQRISIMLKIMDFKDREFASLLSEALDDIVVHKIDSGTAKERYSKIQLARLIVQELGNLKSSEYAESVFGAYNDTDNPDLKSDAAIALGQMRATDYAERFAADLQSINLKPDPAEFRGQEIVALGLVKSLDSMRSIKGYEPVFLASLGWYSSVSKVKETARAALVTMVDDPTESVLTIVVNNSSIDIKTAALASVLSSKASDEKKASVATTALDIAINRATNDVASRTAVSKLRVTALDALAGLQDHTAANVNLYAALIKMDKKNDATLEETLKSYVALGVNGSDEAAKYLSAKLSEYNELERSKANTVRDKSLIRQIVVSMKTSKNPVVKNSLNEGLYIDYDNSILRLMRDAVNSFPK
jgi:hypothetical protein